MKTNVDPLPLELCEKLLRILRRVPSNVQLYWARNEEQLEKMLKKVEGFEPVTFSESKPYELPAVKATDRKVLWKKRLLESHHIDEYCRCVLMHQPPQPACKIRACYVHVTLRSYELFKELGITSANDLRSSAFSYSQIVSVLNRHNDEKKKDGILFYEGTTHFPLMLPTGEVEFVCFQSRKPWRVHAGWRGWFGGPAPENFFKGQLLLRQSTEI